jgi:O-antigen ligase
LIQQNSSTKRLLAGPESRSLRRRSTEVRRGPRTGVATVLVAAFGLCLCAGLFSVFLTPQQFRIVKHLFYALIAFMLLLDFPAAVRVARRDPWVWALVGLMCASALWSDMPAWAIKRGLVTFQTTTFGLYLALRLSLADQVRVLAWVLAVTLVANVVYLVVAPGSAFMVYAGERAFMGFLGHKNGVGLLAALALPIFLLEARTPGARRWVMLSGIVVAAVLLVLSRSLTGAGVGLTLCMVVALLPLSRRLRRPAIVLFPPAVLGIGTIASIAGFADGVLVLLGRDPTLSGRTEIWHAVLPVILERPLLGNSIVSFWQLAIVEKTHLWFSNAHNGYLQLLIELGVVGLALLVLQTSSTLFHAVRWHGRQAGRGAIWPICMGSLFLLYNLTEVVLMRENSVIWVLVVATSLGVRRAAARRRRGPRRRGGPGMPAAKG